MIEVKNLTKKYGRRVAVDNVSFTVESGKIYGFLGPNGAGKTTTMNIITGCLAATEGTVSVDGHDIFEDPIGAKKMIGYLPEQPPLYLDMSVADYLNFVAQAKKIPAKQRRESIGQVLERTGTADVKNRLIRNLSKGYRQRIGLAQAILGNPGIIILDEPTVGLDPHQIIEIRELIRSLATAHTVLLSSHIMQEISAVCDYILILSKGKLVASNTPENLEKEALQGRKHSLTMLAQGSECAIRKALEPIAGIVSCDITNEPDGVRVCLGYEADDDLRKSVFYAMAGAHCAILEMSSRRLSLEDIFLELTDDTANESAPVSAGGTEEPKDAAEDTSAAEDIGIEKEKEGRSDAGNL